MPSRDDASHSQQAPPAGRNRGSVSISPASTPSVTNHSVTNHSVTKNSVSGKKDHIENKNTDQLLPAKPANQPVEKKDELNYACRWVTDVGQVTGKTGSLASIVVFENNIPGSPNATTIYNDIQISTAIGSGAGLLFGLAGHALCVRNNWYTKGGLDPLYRKVKTLGVAGWAAGTIAASFTAHFMPCSDALRPFLTPIFAAGACLVFGAMAPLYMLYKHTQKKDPADDHPVENANESYCRTGCESHSKYLKSALVGGTFLGPAAGALYDQEIGSDISKDDVNTATAITGFGAFLLGMVLVPGINRLGRTLGYDGNILETKKEFDEEGNPVKPEGFRNNYLRTGMQLGGSLLAMILILASGAALYVAPLTLLIYGGIASVGMGLLFGAIGHKISPFLAKHWNLGKDPENGWDYATRGVSMTFGSVGTIVGLCFGNPILGAAIGGVFGWFAGLFAVWLPRKFISEDDNKSTSLPWSQRTGTGGIIGIAIGTGVGLVLALGSGPLAPVALLLFPAIGSLIGNVIGGLCGRQTRKTIRLMISGEEKEPDANPARPARPARATTARTIERLRRRHSMSRSSALGEEDDVNPVDPPSPKENEQKDLAAVFQQIPADLTGETEQEKTVTIEHSVAPAKPANDNTGLLPRLSLVGAQHQKPQQPAAPVIVVPYAQQLVAARA